MKDKETLVNAICLLSKAYAFAKGGESEIAGRLFVQAAEDGNLDEVMDGIAQSAEAMDDENFIDLDDEDDAVEVLSGSSCDSDEDCEEDEDEDYMDEDEDTDDEGNYEDDEEELEVTSSVSVELPPSVARLAARTLI